MNLPDEETVIFAHRTDHSTTTPAPVIWFSPGATFHPPATVDSITSECDDTSDLAIQAYRQGAQIGKLLAQSWQESAVLLRVIDGLKCLITRRLMLCDSGGNHPTDPTTICSTCPWHSLCPDTTAMDSRGHSETD